MQNDKNLNFFLSQQVKKNVSTQKKRECGSSGPGLLCAELCSLLIGAIGAYTTANVAKSEEALITGLSLTGVAVAICCAVPCIISLCNMTTTISVDKNAVEKVIKDALKQVAINSENDFGKDLEKYLNNPNVNKNELAEKFEQLLNNEEVKKLVDEISQQILNAAVNESTPVLQGSVQAV